MAESHKENSGEWTEVIAAVVSGLRVLRGFGIRCVPAPIRTASATRIAFGQGPAQAQLLIVARQDDPLGPPFTGEAGQLLDRMLGAMGLSREEVFVCLATQGASPATESGPLLEERVAQIRPSHILGLGDGAVGVLCQAHDKKTFSDLRGRLLPHPSGARLLFSFHPGYLLQNPAAKKLAWQDLQKVMTEMKLKPKERR